MNYAPIVDISEHQGAIDFKIMRAKGVSYLIMRVAHGMTMDKRFSAYYSAALTAGYEPWEIAFYSFINPKRGSAKATAEFVARIILDVTGRQAVTYMPDVESYRNESPDKGQVTLTGAAFSRYLQDHVRYFEAVMPGCYTKLWYSNYAFWNSSEGPNDDVLASKIEWMVPRYPLYSDAAYQLKGYPPLPDQWDEYAFKLQPKGPITPRGGVWRGWQFSAGFNKQGPVYGCTSTDLDLNFADPAYAGKWFPQPTNPPDPTPIEPLEASVLIPHRGHRLITPTPFPEGISVVNVFPGTPKDATGVAINITVNGSLEPGYAAFWAGSDDPPMISQVNWPIHATGQPARNSMTVTQIVNGQFLVYCTAEVNLLLDQVGYTMPPVPGPAGPAGPPGPAGQGTTPEQIIKVVSDELND